MNRIMLGEAGEQMAASYLEAIGHEILERRYRTKFGEVDIISFLDKALYFVEVKTRSGNRFGRPAEAVTREKVRHIMNVSESFMKDNPRIVELANEIRVQVIEVSINRIDVV